MRLYNVTERVALDDEAFVVDARVGVRSVVQPGVDHAHQLVGGGKDPSRIRRSADPTTDRGQSYMALSKPRTTEPGSGDDHADTGRHLAPGVTHLPGAAPVTAEIA